MVNIFCKNSKKNIVVNVAWDFTFPSACLATNFEFDDNYKLNTNQTAMIVSKTLTKIDFI